MKGLILALGAPNDAFGRLSIMAQNRLDTVLSLYKYNPSFLITCTGGIGKPFNETDQPHYYYSYQYLRKKGIPDNALVDPIYSTHTVDDFTQSKELIHTISPTVLIVVSSDFHMERVKIIHDRFLKFPSTVFIGAVSTVSEEMLKELISHESKAIQKLMESR